MKSGKCIVSYFLTFYHIKNYTCKFFSSFPLVIPSCFKKRVKKHHPWGMALKNIKGRMRKEGEILERIKWSLIGLKYMSWIHIYFPPTNTNQFPHSKMIIPLQPCTNNKKNDPSTWKWHETPSNYNGNSLLYLISLSHYSNSKIRLRVEIMNLKLKRSSFSWGNMPLHLPLQPMDASYKYITYLT